MAGYFVCLGNLSSAGAFLSTAVFLLVLYLQSVINYTVKYMVLAFVVFKDDIQI